MESVPLTTILEEEEEPIDMSKPVDVMLAVAELENNYRLTGWNYTLRDNLVPKQIRAKIHLLLSHTAMAPKPIFTSSNCLKLYVGPILFNNQPAYVIGGYARIT